MFKKKPVEEDFDDVEADEDEEDMSDEAEMKVIKRQVSQQQQQPKQKPKQEEAMPPTEQELNDIIIGHIARALELLQLKRNASI